MPQCYTPGGDATSEPTAGSGRLPLCPPGSSTRCEFPLAEPCLSPGLGPAGSPRRCSPFRPCVAFGVEALAHAVAQGDKGYIQEISGVHLIPFVYLGAKHMVTGYDHLLFLVGVIFFLYRVKDIALYVTLFAIGHSTTLLFGVLYGVGVSAYLIDAIIGFSVVYKALDNLGAFQRWFGFQPNTKARHPDLRPLPRLRPRRPRSRNSTSLPTGSCRTSSPSTSASRSASSSPCSRS